MAILTGKHADQVIDLERKLHDWLLANGAVVEYRLPLMACALIKHVALIISMMPGTVAERQELQAALVELLAEQVLAGERPHRKDV